MKANFHLPVEMALSPFSEILTQLTSVAWGGSLDSNC